jgi:uncharacterized protein (TIGR03067 family)
MKSRLLLAGTAALLLATWAIGGETEDLRMLAGTWSAMIVEMAGKETTPQERGRLKLKLVIRGDNYAIFMDKDQLASGIVRLDGSTKPARIDVIPQDGPHKGKVQPGIYAFQGEDLWTVFAAPGEPRPTGFKTRPDSTESMYFYRRAK